MQIVSSYGVEIKKKNIPLRSTLDIFRKAVSYLISVYAETWEELSETKTENSNDMDYIYDYIDALKASLSFSNKDDAPAVS